MITCTHSSCDWQAIAPSTRAAWNQYVEHLVTEHTTQVDATVPAGKVQIKLDSDDEWVTVTIEEAKEIHEALHEE